MTAEKDIIKPSCITESKKKTYAINFYMQFYDKNEYITFLYLKRNGVRGQTLQMQREYVYVVGLLILCRPT